MARRPPKPVLVLVLAAALGGVVWYVGFRDRGGDDDGLTLYGNIDVRQVDLAFSIDGPIAEMRVEEGDRVEPGQIIATLDRRPYAFALGQAEAQVAEAEADLENARRTLARQADLLKRGNAPQQTYDDARRRVDASVARLNGARETAALAAYRLGRADLVSTVGGTVLTRIREPGAVVMPNSPVYTISIADPVWARTYVDEPHLGHVVPGMKAEITTDSAPGRVYPGWVGFVSPTAEFTPKSVETPELRTDLVYRVRVYVKNPDHTLRQGMPVTVRLLEGTAAGPAGPGDPEGDADADVAPAPGAAADTAP